MTSTPVVLVTAYHYEELTISSLVLVMIIASTHFAYPRKNGQAELAWAHMRQSPKTVAQSTVWVCQVAVPSSTTLATMSCQSSLASEALMNSVELTLSFHDSPRLSRYFSLWRPFTFLPSILPITTKFSRPCFFNTCPRKASFRWRIVLISVWKQYESKSKLDSNQTRSWVNKLASPQSYHYITKPAIKVVVQSNVTVHIYAKGIVSARPIDATVVLFWLTIPS